jgi:prepilin peptidase CpaA
LLAAARLEASSLPYWLPMFGLLAFSAVATLLDVLRREIPNGLVQCGLLVGLALNTASAPRPWLTLGLALLAIGVAAVLTVPLWLVGGLGGGDVKLLVACGAFLTPLSLLSVLGHSLLLFGLFAMVLSAVEDRLGPALVASTRFLLGYRPDESGPRGPVLHFAPAVLGGTVFAWVT